MFESEKTISYEENLVEKRIHEGNKWGLNKGGETYTVTPFPPFNPIILIREEGSE